jgi:hypothetical protein
MSLFVKKPLGQLLAQADEGDKGLKRTLGAGNLVALGIGAIIGAGLFVRTGCGSGCYHLFYYCCDWLCFCRSVLCRICSYDSYCR